MEYPKNGKKAKNGVRQDEQLLINYSGGEQHTESDSDRVKPLELPPTRLRRPKSRKIRVSSSNSKSVFSFWNFCQVVFVIVVIGTMISMVWFTIILKTSLDSMKKRVSILETSDRSTSKECANKGQELQKKLEALRETTAGLVATDDKQFKSLLKRFSILNKTVDSLHKRLKSPKSVSSIHSDISLLKKAMADTGREMTEVTDKVTQLRRIAHLQNNNIKHLKVQMYNVTVQLAKLAGKPTPRPVINTGTPPWLLRMPADSNSHSKPEASLVEMEKVRKNITSYVKKDISKIVAYVKRANKSVHSHVHSLQEKLSTLVKHFANHKALMEKLIKKSKQDITEGNETTIHHKDDSIDYEISNLTHLLDTLKDQFGSQNKKFEEMSLDVTSINHTLHGYILRNSKTTPASCNCSLENVWKTLSKDEGLMKTLQSKTDELQKSIEQLRQKETSPTLATPVITANENTTPAKPKNESVKTTTKPEHTKRDIQTSTVRPTTSTEKYSTVNQTDIGEVSQTTKAHTTQITTPSSKTDKRATDEDDDDLNSWPGGDDIDDQPLPNDSP